MRRPIAIVLLGGLALVGWLTWAQHRPAPFVVSGYIEADEIRVGSRVGGRVSEVLAEEGANVARDVVLFRLDPFDLEAALAQARAELAIATAEHARLQAGFRAEEIEQGEARRRIAEAVLAKAVAGPRPQEIAVAREQVNIAQATWDLAEAEFARRGSLVEQDQISKESFDQAARERTEARAQLVAAEQGLALMREGTREEDVAAAGASLAEAEQALALMRAGFRREDVAKAAAQVDAARANVQAFEVRIAELVVRAPCDCVVEAIELRPGDLVAPNAPAVSLLDLSRLWVRSYVPEGRLNQVDLGEQVPIRVDGFADERFLSRVTFISREGEFTPRNIQTPEERSKQVFRVKLTLEEGLERLRVGMAADVLFDEASAP